MGGSREHDAKRACLLAMGKAHVSQNQVRYLFGGDLLRQGIATSMGVESADSNVRALRGMFNIGRSIGIGIYECGSRIWRIYTCSDLQSFWKCGKRISFSTSYAKSKTIVAHWTVTGSGVFLVGKKESHVRISGLTVGKIVDYGLKDSQNIGSVYGAAHVIRSGRIYRILEDRRKIIPGLLQEISDMWDRAFFLICCLKKVMISVENTWTVV